MAICPVTEYLEIRRPSRRTFQHRLFYGGAAQSRSDLTYAALHASASSSALASWAIFDLAAEERTGVIGQHFPPFPSLGHVVKQGEGWEWQPMNPAR